MHALEAQPLSRAILAGDALPTHGERPLLPARLPAVPALPGAGAPLTVAEERIGPYRIVGSLGHGGMGIVRLGIHVESGARVAVKSVLVREAAYLSTLRREIHALARLRHPGIVRIVDHGVAADVPWYAMEVVEGRELREHLDVARASGEATLRIGGGADAPTESMASMAASGGQPIDAGHLDRVVTVTGRLCSALSYLHGEGFVHRDLKPGNVIVAPGDHPVLIDFGLAESVAGEKGREALALANEVSGTVSYMAPEQAAGLHVDARADLYALGCILYELLAGRPPFLGDLWSVLRKHRDVAPEALSVHVEGVPAGLADLVARLLAKEPRRRIGYACDVAAALDELGARPAEREAPAARAYVYRAALAGRGEARETLRARIRRTLAGPGGGGIVRVEGESGVGKTRLVADVAAEAMREGMVAIASTCENPAIRPPRPLEAFLPLLRFVGERCRREGSAEAARILGPRANVLAQFDAALEAIPGLPPAPPPAPLAGLAGQERAIAHLLQTLVETAAGVPLLLAIDDVAWADELSVAFLRHAASSAELAAARVLVVATCRTEDAASRPLPGDRIVLDRLDAPSVAAMTRDMLALPSPLPELESFLAAQSEGNPLFVAEYLKAAIAHGHLVRDAGGAFRLAGGATLASLPLPRNVAELLEGRLAQLGDVATEVLEIAAVIGRDVNGKLLSDVATGSMTAEESDVGLQRLLAAQVLEERQGRVRFAHDRMREAAYARIDGERRRALHRRVALSLEAGGLPADDRGDFGAALATHWHRAGDLVRARSLYLAAAGAAHRRHALDVAETLTREGLALFDAPTRESVGARNAFARLVLQVQGKPGQLEEHTRALADARAIGDTNGEAESLNDLGYVRLREGRLEDARSSFEASLAVATAAGDLAHMAHASGSVSLVLADLGRRDAAAMALQRSLALFREAGDRRGEALMVTNHGCQQQARGDLAAAEESYRAAIAAAEAIGDTRLRAYGICYLGTLRLQQGEPLEASLLQEQALRLAREVGDRDLEAQVLGASGDIRFEARDAAGALELLQECEDILRAMGATARVAEVRLSVATALVELERVEEAAGLLEAALATLRSRGSPQLVGSALGQLADVERRRGTLERAASLAMESVELLASTGEPRRLLESVCVQGHIALACGADATEHLARARGLAEHAGSSAASLVDTLARACHDAKSRAV